MIASQHFEQSRKLRRLNVRLVEIGEEGDADAMPRWTVGRRTTLVVRHVVHTRTALDWDAGPSGPAAIDAMLDDELLGSSTTPLEERRLRCEDSESTLKIMISCTTIECM